MTKITASEVNNLRKQTGAGMMDCKKALVEAEGDFELAVDLLRKQGQKVAAKRGDRSASEGLVIAKASSDATTGILVSLNCETDFVAKNDAYIAFANKIAEIAIEHTPSSLEELSALSYNGNGQSIADKIIEETGKIGEKIEIATYELVKTESVIAYNHPGNQIASLVGLNKTGNSEVGRDVAMQVAAMAPIALDQEGVSQETIDKEVALGTEIAIAEGKPADLAEKIAKGKLSKWFKENTLLNQAFIKENKLSVKQYLEQKESGLTVTSFKRYSLG